MRKKYARFLGIVTSFVMLVSTMFASGISAKASEIGNDALFNAAKSSISALQDTQSIKDKAYAERENYMKNANDKIERSNKYFNDNGTGTKFIDGSKNVRVIVELDGKAIKDMTQGVPLNKIASSTTLKESVLDSQSSVKSQIQKLNPEAKIRNSYYAIMNGFSVETKAKDIDTISEMAGVKRVSIANEYYPAMNTAKDITNVTQAWAAGSGNGYKGQGMVIAIVDSGIDPTHKDMRLSDSTKPKLSASDINAKSLGKYFTPKVPYGYNFADKSYDIIDKNPNIGMHGMHVAGIVAANCASDEEVKANKGIRGVAPEAQLLAMKVFSNNPTFSSAFSDDIIAAIDDSVAHGADVINMSLGSPAGYVDDNSPEQIAVNNATQNGVVVAVAAGNDQYSTAPYKLNGMYDTGIVGSPATAKSAFMVASYENTNVAGPSIDYVEGSNTENAYYTTSEVDPVGVLDAKDGYELVDCGIGDNGSATGKDDFEEKNLKGKIALIQRGTTTFIEKKQNAQAAGAVGVIVYNRAGDNTYLNMATDASVKIPAVFVNNADGVKLKGLISSGLRVHFNGTIVSIANSASGNMSDFSSWGPTPEIDLRPQISAPGGNIWSTVNNNKYENMSGTSMATPHVAGLSALVMQYIETKLPTVTGKDREELAKTLLINTAKVSIDPGAKGLPFSPRRQGAGLADVNAAVHNYVTALCEGEAVASLHQITPEASGDTTRTFEVTLHNYGTNDATYNVKNNYSVMTEQSENTASMSYDVALKDAKVRYDGLESEIITVPANGDKKIEVTLTIPQTAAKDNYAEGFITFESSDANVPSLGMPYMGFYGNWNDESVMDAPIWDPDNSVFMAEGVGTLSGDSKYTLGFTGNYDDYGNPIIDKDAIGINPSDKDANNNAIPILSFLRNAKDNVIEIVDSNGKVIRQIAKDFNMRKSSAKDTTYVDSAWAWDGTVYNSKTGKYDPAPDGQYSIQVRNKLDYGTSEQTAEQTFQMPVKVDSVAPQISDLNLTNNGSGSYSLKFKASDNDGGTKLQGFVFIIDNDIYRVDKEGMQRLQPDKDGYYTFDMNINGGHHIITVAAFDYAGNVGFGETEIANLAITEPYSNSSFNTGEFDVKFEVNPSVLDSISHYTVAADPVGDEDGSKIIMLGDVDKTKTSYRVTGLDPGDYIIIVAAIPSDQNTKITYTDAIKVKINQPQKLGLTVKNVEPGSFISTPSLNVLGSFQVMPQVFKINDIDMLQTINKNTLEFNAPITLSKGLNKVHFYGELYDVFGRLYDTVDYSINVYGAFEVPTLNITTPSALIGNDYVDYVGSTATSYTVNGSVEDTESGMGYRLYVNGNQIITVTPEVPETAESSLKSFSYDVPLTDKVTNIKVEAVNLAGIGISKNIVVRKLDYPEACIDFDNLSEGATLEGTDAVITGHYNVYAKPKSLSINDQAAVFANDSDTFSVSVKLTEGTNSITVKATDADDKTTIDKSFNVTCVIPDATAPSITIENKDIPDPSTDTDIPLVIVKRSDTNYEIKGTVTDDNPGITVCAYVNDSNGDPIYNEMVDSITTTASFDFNIKLTEGYEKIIIEAQDKALNKAYKFVDIARVDDFMSAGIFFDKILDGAIFPSKEVRFSGYTEKPLEYFTIGGKNVPMAQDGTFAVDLPLDEGTNSVEITAESAITVNTEVTTDAAIDTTGGAIDTTGGATETTTDGAIDTTGGTAETTSSAIEVATDGAIKIDEFVNIICDTTLPEINIDEPIDASVPMVIPSAQDKITVSGTAKDATGLQLFTINGKNVDVDAQGKFTTDVSVNPGYNKISIIAEDMAGNYNFANINVNRLSTEDTSLESIKINGVDLEGFRPDVHDYTFVVAGTIDKVPEVSFIIPYSKISKESAEITKAAGIPGTTEIKVTSEDGKVNTYKINFINAVNIQKVQPVGNGLQIGHDATVAFNASNATNNDQDATLIVALYDSNNKFVTFAAAHQVIAPKGSTQLLALLDMPDVLGNGYKVKCFVWDTLQGMSPLSKVIELQVSR